MGDLMQQRKVVVSLIGPHKLWRHCDEVTTTIDLRVN